MNLFLVIFISVCCIMFILNVYIIYKNIKLYKSINNGNYKVKHRLDNEGNLQYSVDGKLWTYIIGYTEDYDYGTYHGPALSYIQFNSDETYRYKSWCNMLYSMQKCHEFNKKALDLYIGKIREYLKDKPEEK